MSYMNIPDDLNVRGTKAIRKALELPQRMGVAFCNHFTNI